MIHLTVFNASYTPPSSSLVNHNATSTSRGKLSNVPANDYMSPFYMCACARLCVYACMRVSFCECGCLRCIASRGNLASIRVTTKMSNSVECRHQRNTTFITKSSLLQKWLVLYGEGRHDMKGTAQILLCHIDNVEKYYL